MIKILAPLLLIALTSCVATQPTERQTNAPDKLAPEVINAEDLGRLLYESYQRGSSVDATAKQSIERFKGRMDLSNDLQYTPFVVESSNGRIIYMIGESSEKGKIVFGKHFKLEGENVSSSTKTHFIMPQPPKNAVGAIVSHLLSDTPTEFHVFLSLKHQTPVLVPTSKGDWGIENGVIYFIRPR